MRIIIFLLFLFLVAQPVFSQVPTKKEIAAEMQQEINDLKKQITDLEKQIVTAKKEDPESVKDLEDELKMLKQQLSMMEGLNKTVSNLKISDKQIQEAVEEENRVVPLRDNDRINSLPKKILTDAEMLSFIKNVHTEVEKLIPAEDKAKALEFYNEAKTKYKSPSAFSSAASGCWMYGHQEKALYIMGKACIENMFNTDNLNNYAAFLSMTGAEQAAIPILEYLNAIFPKNNTILNNLGQAWFGLGDLTNAKKYLDSVVELYPGHSQANMTLSKIYLSKADSVKAIAFLKKSIKESYDAEKEADLEKLGSKLEYKDLPEFGYPMKKDPFGLEPFFTSFPDYPSSLDDMEIKQSQWDGFDAANQKRIDELEAKLEDAKRHTKELEAKLKDPVKQKPIMKRHNSSPWKKAVRYAQLANENKASITIDGIMTKIMQAYSAFTTQPLKNALAARDRAAYLINEKYAPCATEGKPPPGCEGDYETRRCNEMSVVNNAFLKKEKQINEEGTQEMYRVYLANKEAVDLYIKYSMYSIVDESDRYKTFQNEMLEKNEWLIKEQRTFYNYYRRILPRPEKIQKCGKQNDDYVGTETWNLPAMKDLTCDYEKTINTPVGYIKITCNQQEQDESKLKNSKEGETKGSAVTGKGELTLTMGTPRRVPTLTLTMGTPREVVKILSLFLPEWKETKNIIADYSPLTPIAVDTPQMYLEYDKYGNLSDIRIPLNKEGTAFADVDSKETGEESRWCWISCASGREKKMKELFKRH